MSFTVAPIVEGYGDVDAVRVLLLKMAPELLVGRPVRFGRGVLTQREGLLRAAKIAAANIREDGAILVLFDADRECAVTLARELSGWLRADFSHRRAAVVLAVRGFESWIVGGDPMYEVDDPDQAGDPKRRLIEAHGTYKKTADQPRYIARADLDRLSQRSRSFQKLRSVITAWQAIASGDE